MAVGNYVAIESKGIVFDPLAISMINDLECRKVFRLSTKHFFVSTLESSVNCAGLSFTQSGNFHFFLHMLILNASHWNELAF